MVKINKITFQPQLSQNQSTTSLGLSFPVKDETLYNSFDRLHFFSKFSRSNHAWAGLLFWEHLSVLLENIIVLQKQSIILVVKIFFLLSVRFVFVHNNTPYYPVVIS